MNLSCADAYALPGAPAISVLMTVYNTAHFLAEAIDSVISQRTDRRWELLVVDDGSSDASLGIAQSYAARYPHQIRVFQHARGENHGISASRNLALHHARSTRLAFLDSDDVWLPHHCETLASVLDGDANIAMVYGAAERWVDFSSPFDENASRAASWGRNYLPPLIHSGKHGGTLACGTLVDWFTADESLCPCICSVMVRAEAARSVGGFCDAFQGLYDDQAFHAKMSLHFPIYALDICVARYRQHDRSCCAIARRHHNDAEEERHRFSSFLEEQRASLMDDLTP